jgi:hypothetical protein
MKKKGKGKEGRNWKKKSSKKGEKNINQSEKERESTSALVREREEKFNYIAKKKWDQESIILTSAPFVLIYKEALLYANDLVGTLSSDTVSLLKKFEDVLPEEVPHGLPPITGIEHQIDFIPGASIPIRPAL